MLPQLGLLPNLKLLVFRRMGSIKRIDDIDLSGGNRAAFSRLSKVTIEDMEKLETFIFPSIAELVIQKCPELSFGPLPPRAQRLVISDCNGVMSSWEERQGDSEEVSSTSTPVTELVVENYNLPQDDSALLHHLPGLHSLTIKNSHGMVSLPEYLSDLTSLRELTIQSCHGMESLLQSMDKLTNLKDLYILDCPGLNKWCESDENKTKLAHIRPKYEKSGASKAGNQQLHTQMNPAAASLAQGAERVLATRRSLQRQATRL